MDIAKIIESEGPCFNLVVIVCLYCMYSLPLSQKDEGINREIPKDRKIRFIFTRSRRSGWQSNNIVSDVDFGPGGPVYSK